MLDTQQPHFTDFIIDFRRLFAFNRLAIPPILFAHSLFLVLIFDIYECHLLTNDPASQMNTYYHLLLAQP
jgi:hypothetical protein